MTLSGVTSDPDFKVTLLSDAEYLRNGTIYRRSYNEILIETYTRPTQCVISHDLEWLSEASRGLSVAAAELFVLVYQIQ